MTRCLLAVAGLAFGASTALGQVYSSSPGFGPIDVSTYVDPIVVTGGPSSITSLSVVVNISTTWCADVDCALIRRDPVNGDTYLHLFSDVGGSADDFTFTRLIDGAPTIVNGVAPFNGSYSPEGGVLAARVGAAPLPATALNNFGAFIGQNANVTWELWVDDDLSGFPCFLNYWSLEFNGATDSQAPQLTGACCLPSGCVVMGSTDCANQGGTFLGAFTTCGEIAYNIQTTDSQYSSIAAIGNILSNTNADDGIALIDIGFDFNYLGNVYTQVNVSTNGNIQFPPSASTAFTNVAIPNTAAPNNMIAPLWDDFDLDLIDGGGDLYSYLDTSGGEGNYTLTISWEGVEQYLNLGDSNDFQVVLFQNGDFEFRYGAITPETPAGDYTIGYEDINGTSGQSIAGSEIGSGFTARRFVAIPPIGPCDGGSSCPACAADYDQNGGVDGADIAGFFSDFEQGAACADVDGNGGVDGADIGAFFQVFEAGGC